MPVSFFRDHLIMTGGGDPEKVFLSSGTTGMRQSRHAVKEPCPLRREPGRVPSGDLLRRTLTVCNHGSACPLTLRGRVHHSSIWSTG
ncbi:MAG: hypothetical protein MZV63_48245 [Marinilabiliales bacterium]|nr:hypothetical protein [Marinilabiliales bacterium]